MPENRIIHWHNSQKRVTRDRHAICNCHILKVCCQTCRKKKKKIIWSCGKFSQHEHIRIEFLVKFWSILTISIIKLFFPRHIFLKIVYFISIILHEKIILFSSDTLLHSLKYYLLFRLDSFVEQKQSHCLGKHTRAHATDTIIKIVSTLFLNFHW